MRNNFISNNPFPVRIPSSGGILQSSLPKGFYSRVRFFQQRGVLRTPSSLLPVPASSRRGGRRLLLIGEQVEVRLSFFLLLSPPSLLSVTSLLQGSLNLGHAFRAIHSYVHLTTHLAKWWWPFFHSHTFQTPRYYVP